MIALFNCGFDKVSGDTQAVRAPQKDRGTEESKRPIGGCVSVWLCASGMSETGSEARRK